MKIVASVDWPPKHHSRCNACGEWVHNDRWRYRPELGSATGWVHERLERVGTKLEWQWCPPPPKVA